MTDIYNELGVIAFVSRMKRLSERMMQSVSQVYSNESVDFEPRWYTVYYTLHRSHPSPIAISEVARQLGCTHPCINQISNEMIKAGLVESMTDDQDRRKRLLQLTPKAIDMYPELLRVWAVLRATAQEITHETGYDIIDVLEKLENVLERKEFYPRYIELAKAQQLNSVEIIEYQPEYREYFRQINQDWIETHFELEAMDQKILNDPEAEILAKGGHIFFARSEGEIIGTCALIKLDENLFELAKMGVAPSARGRQIGKRLGQAAIDKAKSLNANAIVLDTNSKLTPAINLYRKLGFVLTKDHAHSPYSRADMSMKLSLTN